MSSPVPPVPLLSSSTLTVNFYPQLTLQTRSVSNTHCGNLGSDFSDLILIGMNLHQWRAWPKNAVVDEDRHTVDPSKPWVPSPDAQLFPLPAEQGPSARSNRVIPDTSSSSRSHRLSLPPPSRHLAGEQHDPLARRHSRLSFHFWRDKLGMNHKS